MNGCVEGIMLRLRTYQDFQFPHDIKFFDMRMLFLLTALCAEIRPKLRNNLHGTIYLMEVLDLILKCNAERLLEQNLHHKKEGKKRYSRGSRKQKGNKCFPDAEQYINPCLSVEEVDLACEVLKVLFNLTVNIDRYNLDEEEEAHFMRLVSILHDILLCDTSTVDKKNELHSHTVNLLTNMPTSSYEELLIPITDIPIDKSDNKEHEYEGMSMEVISVLLKFMENRLDKKTEIKEGLTPVLTCLCECARANRTIRKYLRIKVLPPLKDVMNRPEEGMTLRNRLVKLMTSPMTDVKELVADFLFILCKENVERLIKYTGYGNAAGLLTNHGLMHGRQGNARDYSSDSDDSDTEEYLKYKDRINPVSGCYEEPKPSPLEGMSEEQKEYEAMQLVNMMNKLTRDGIIQPMKVGDDGKPHPVEHMLELRE
ncbi:synembryn-A-like [Centruroides sculpturatus]|uniref:synembryn-A-like n=1 Tax=Centruroides sculpturatus TaxID=218467 RepID=UPI000C6D4F2F|nr:synembryn-A-like [Centruroides sculpturatus]